MLSITLHFFGGGGVCGRRTEGDKSFRFREAEGPTTSSLESRLKKRPHPSPPSRAVPFAGWPIFDWTVPLDESVFFVFITSVWCVCVCVCVCDEVSQLVYVAFRSFLVKTTV